MSTFIAAIVKGFVEFDPAVPIVGIVVTNVMSQNHFELIKGAITRYVKNVPVLGYLPFKSANTAVTATRVSSRQRIASGGFKNHELGQLQEAHIDLKIQLLTLAGTSVDAHLPSPIVTQQVDSTLGIAQDDARLIFTIKIILKRLGSGRDAQTVAARLQTKLYQTASTRCIWVAVIRKNSRRNWQRIPQ